MRSRNFGWFVKCLKKYKNTGKISHKLENDCSDSYQFIFRLDKKGSDFPENREEWSKMLDKRQDNITDCFK